MKIITRAVLDWATSAVLEEDSYEYTGPVAYAKDSGQPPQAVDPYQQAAAQYGLSTGTALFNAGLNRTNTSNPLGNSTWNASYPGASPTSPGAPGTPGTPAPGTPTGFHTVQPQPSPGVGTQAYNPNAPFGLGGYAGAPGYAPQSTGTQGMTAGGQPTAGTPYNGSPTGSPTGGAPTYTNTTQLAPQFQSTLDQPIDTSGLPGMPGGPDISQNLKDTQNAIYSQNMAYLQPQEAQAGETLNSTLANEGLAPGSAAYQQAQDQLNRNNTFSNQQAENAAITGGDQEQATLFGLGTQGLQNQITARNAPLNEFETLSGNGAGAAATAQTPDISGAFGQQLNSQIAGYNANTASNNATTGDIASIAALALMFSDRRLKEDIREVGKTKGGLPVYTYRYKGDGRTQMGVMAQDVEKEHPEAVFGLGGRDNLKMVDYGAIS